MLYVILGHMDLVAVLAVSQFDKKSTKIYTYSLTSIKNNQV